MKEFLKSYLQVINEDLDVSSKYIDKKYFATIGHCDVFYTTAFLKGYSLDYTLINIFVNKFIVMTNAENLKSDKEFLIYEPAKNVAAIVKVFVKGSFRHDIILDSSWNASSIPSITKTGQTRIIFEQK